VLRLSWYLARLRAGVCEAVARPELPVDDGAIAGVLLPMAQHKGYAIAVIMDMLSGVLTGSAFGSGVHGPYQAEARSGAGHLMIVLDIAAMQPLREFGTRMESDLAELKAVPPAPGFDEVFYPGEIEARNDVKHRAEGLRLAPDTWADLERLGEDLGLALP
jgi:LDH2 family malate/lactate/ureidoglycolate dehydrogenase